MPPEFFQTPMGRRFYEHTVPELAKQLERVADGLEALLVRLAKRDLEREARR
jgi:hypothetical protein